MITNIYKTLESWAKELTVEYEVEYTPYDVYKALKRDYIVHHMYEDHPDFCGYIEMTREDIELEYGTGNMEFHTYEIHINSGATCYVIADNKEMAMEIATAHYADCNVVGIVDSVPEGWVALESVDDEIQG